MTAPRISPRDWTSVAAGPGSRGSSVWKPVALRVVEVDDDLGPAVGDPDADADAIVFGVHQVDVMAATPAFCLEILLRVDHQWHDVHALRTADVLGPPVAVITR